MWSRQLTEESEVREEVEVEYMQGCMLGKSK